MAAQALPAIGAKPPAAAPTAGAGGGATPPPPPPAGDPSQFSIERVNELFTKYNTTATVIGGLAQGFGSYQQAKIAQEVPRKQLELEREKWDQRQKNTAATVTIPNLRELQALQQQQPGLLGQGAR